VLGFARDLALNSRFGGQGPLMDCWATAQMLPNLFRRLFAEGAFSQGFVPVFAAARATEGAEAADKMASQAMAFILTIVAIVTIGIEVAMPFIMPLLLSAYLDDPGTLAIATLMAQLAMPYLVFMTLASLLSGVLNTLGRFALTAAAPILLNVCTLYHAVLATVLTGYLLHHVVVVIDLLFL
jgi:putative peptidoglycan lipid II flippase